MTVGGSLQEGWMSAGEGSAHFIDCLELCFAILCAVYSGPLLGGCTCLDDSWRCNCHSQVTLTSKYGHHPAGATVQVV